MVNNVLEYMKWGNYIKSEIFIPTCAFIEYPIRLLANPDEQHIDKNIVSKVDHAVTESTNALHIIKLVNKALDSINEYLYFCCLKLVPTIGIKDLNMKLWSNELYKLKPFICFTNQHIENITSSKIGINDEEWEINYNLEKPKLEKKAIEPTEDRNKMTELKKELEKIKKKNEENLKQHEENLKKLE